MPTRDDFRFVLLPWEHRGAQFDPRPDCITTIEFAGAQRTVLLKARADRLFFRFADWMADESHPAVFAVTTPFSVPINHAEFFHEAMAQKSIARYVLHKYTHGIKGHTTLLWLINENAASQTGWAREWCGGDWMAWEDKLPSYFDHSIWDEKWYPSFSRAMYDPIWPTLARRHFGPQERHNTPPRWVCGSPEELSRVLRAYFCAFPDAAQEINERLEEWGEYGGTGDTRVRMWAWSAGTSGVHMRATLWSNALVGDSFHSEIFNDVEPRWAELMVHHNHAVGLTWHHDGTANGQRRENWWYETPVFDLDVPLPFPVPPSQHEQLEARLELREWLRDKIPDANIEAWLCPTPA